METVLIPSTASVRQPVGGNRRQTRTGRTDAARVTESALVTTSENTFLMDNPVRRLQMMTLSATTMMLTTVRMT